MTNYLPPLAVGQIWQCRDQEYVAKVLKETRPGIFQIGLKNTQSTSWVSRDTYLTNAPSKDGTTWGWVDPYFATGYELSRLLFAPETTQ